MDFYGLETLHSSCKSDLKTPSDVLVLFFHWKLSKEGFLCVGIGEDTSRSGTELLPSGWNAEPTVYQINYKNKDKEFLLKVVVVEDLAIINLLRCSDKKNTDVELKIQDYIGDQLEDFARVFINKEALASKADLVFQPLIDKQGNAKEVESSENKKERRSQEEDLDPLRTGRGRPRVDHGPPDWERVGPPRIGGSDLDPLGGILGGGMLMDPRGGIRPMEPRWDPVGPLDPFGGLRGGPAGGRLGRGGRGGRSFGDELPPPGWGNMDNMYM